MSMPGFTAESSIGRRLGIYRQRALAHEPVGLSSGRHQANMMIIPQLPREQQCTTIHSGYITYPMVVCRPPNLSTGGNQTVLDAVGSTRSRLISGQVRATPLSTFCRTINGPWLAYVVQHESCDFRDPDSFALTISGAPQKVELTWQGTLQDVPGPVGAIGNLSPSIPSCSCCGARKQCPDGSCVPFQVSCGNIGPA
jgi:hypothetical protein